MSTKVEALSGKLKSKNKGWWRVKQEKVGKKWHGASSVQKTDEKPSLDKKVN